VYCFLFDVSPSIPAVGMGGPLDFFFPFFFFFSFPSAGGHAPQAVMLITCTVDHVGWGGSWLVICALVVFCLV